MTVRLYPSRFFAPPQAPAETVTEDKWHHNHSQPDASLAKRRAQVAVVAALAGFVLTPIDYPGTGNALASTVTTSVRHDRTIIYDELAYTPYIEVAAAEVVTLDKYWQPLSEPARRITTRQRQELAFAGLPLDTVLAWHRPFSEPTRRVTTRQQQAIIQAGLPPDSVIVGVPGDGAFVPGTLSTSVRYDKTVIFDDLAWAPYPLDVVAEVVTSDKWFSPLSLPTRRKGAVLVAGVLAPVQPQATDTVAGWHRPFSEPVRRVTTRQKQDIVFAGKPDDPSYWFPRLSEPTRAKVTPNQGYLANSYYPVAAGAPGDDTARAFTVSTSVRHDKTVIFQDVAYTPYVPPAAPTAVFASATFGGPVFTSYRIAQTLAYVPAPYAPGIGTEFNWWPNLSERLRQRRPVAQQQAVIQGPALPFTVTLEYGWHRPFSERLNRARRAPEFPAFAYSPYFVPAIPGSGAEFNWWPNLSERLRQRRPVTQQQAVIQGPAQPFTVTLEYGWHRPFSEPTRRKKEAQTAGAVFHPFPQITIAWQRPLDLPTRRKRDLGLYGQTPFIWVSPTGTGVGTTQPWPPFSEPVRFRQGLRHSQQQTLVWYPLVLTADLDPACRIIEPFDADGTITSEGGVTVEATGQTALVSEDGEEQLTPEPGKVLKVDC